MRCQLIDEKGKCKRAHGWGWIAQLRDGTEGYIGHDCAEGHFQADPRYAGMFLAASARVDEEITTDQLISRLQGLLSNSEVATTLNLAWNRWRAISDRIGTLRLGLAPDIRAKLLDKLKRGDNAVLINVLYIEWKESERTGEKRQVIKPRPVRWGHLSGLEILKSNKISQVGRRLAEANDAGLAATASIDQKTEKMNKWASALEYWQRAHRDLDEIEATVGSFCLPQNLKLLWLFASKRKDQVALVRTALELTSQSTISEAEASITRDNWEREVVTAHNGLEFEVAE